MIEVIDHSLPHVRFPVVLSCKSTPRTQQHFRDECDVNQIMKKYRRTGDLTHLNRSEGRYGDFSNATTYQEALSAISDAQNDFDLLPADVRREMDNDPAKLLAFMEDPINHDRAVELGLINADPLAAADPSTSAQPPVASPPPQPETPEG